MRTLKRGTPMNAGYARRPARLLVGVVAAIVTGLVAAAPMYNATPLGTLGGTGGSGNGINAAGQVTGFSYTAGNATWHAVSYDANGARHDLGTLGGAFSSGTGINDHGQVAGFAATPNAKVAFLYSGGVMKSLGALGGTNSSGSAINASGQVTGYAELPGGTEAHAFVYANGVMTDLGAMGGTYSVGNGLNASGQVTGMVTLPDSPMLGTRQHAFHYANGTMVDIGTLGGSFSAGTAINDQGQIVGDALTTGANAGIHAFLYSGGVMKDLGTLGGSSSFAFGINAGGQVTGTADTVDNAHHAFLYANGTMYDLNALVIGRAGTVLNVANAINDSGQIVASGCSASLICQSFRLDPLTASPAVATVKAVEFHHAALDGYFITAIRNEIDALDSGMIAGWARTGEAFNVYSGPSVDSATVCRFFSTSFAPKSMHFYTQDAGECTLVSQNADWEFEGAVMNIGVPGPAGNCGAGTQSVYRVYNNGQGGVPGHRYTTSPAIRAQMLARGWIAEGYGANGVIMCAPL